MPRGCPPVLACDGVRAGFIDALVRLRSVKLAVAETGIAMRAVYRARRMFPDFAAAWVAARDGVPPFRPQLGSGPSALARASFLAALGSGLSISAAARRARRHRTVFYDLRRRDADFGASWAEASAQAIEELESLTVERIIHGVERTVFAGGVAHQVRVIDLAAGLRFLDRRAAAGPERGGGRLIELTPESVAIARRKVVELMVGQGVAGFEL